MATRVYNDLILAIRPGWYTATAQIWLLLRDRQTQKVYDKRIVPPGVKFKVRDDEDAGVLAHKETCHLEKVDERRPHESYSPNRHGKKVQAPYLFSERRDEDAIIADYLRHGGSLPGRGR